MNCYSCALDCLFHDLLQWYEEDMFAACSEGIVSRMAASEEAKRSKFSNTNYRSCREPEEHVGSDLMQQPSMGCPSENTFVPLLKTIWSRKESKAWQCVDLCRPMWPCLLVSKRSEAFPVHDWWTRLVVLCLGNPHLQPSSAVNDQIRQYVCMNWWLRMEEG